MNKYVLVDLDDTLANISERKQYYGKDWDRYNELIPTDTVIKDNKDIIDILDSESIIIFTGREERYRILTEEWLCKMGIKYHKLIMKPNDRAKESSVKWKREYLDNHRNSILAVMDDRSEVIERAMQLNIPIIVPCKVI